MRGWYNECRVSENREADMARRARDLEISNYYGNLLARMREENTEKEALTEGEGESLPTKEVRETKHYSNEELLENYQKSLKALEEARK